MCLLIHSQKTQGFSLVETILSISIVSILFTGIITLVHNYKSDQEKIKLQHELISLQNNFEKIIQDPSAWRHTVQDTSNVGLDCLRQRTPCTSFISTTYTPTLNRIILKDGANNIFYDGRSINNKGFTTQGKECTGFSYNINAGNNDCPVGFIVSWRALSSANDPQIVVTAKLVFNPSNSHPYKKFFNQDETNSVLGKYDVSVYKKSMDRNVAESLEICTPGQTRTCISDINGKSEETCNPEGTGYGQCTLISCNAPYYINNGACSRDGGWSSWSSCSASCGYYTQYGTQSRSCNSPTVWKNGLDCPGPSTQSCSINCGPPPPPGGGGGSCNWKLHASFGGSCGIAGCSGACSSGDVMIDMCGDPTPNCTCECQ